MGYTIRNTRTNETDGANYATAEQVVTAWYAAGGRAAGWRIYDAGGARVDEADILSDEARAACFAAANAS